MNSFVGDMCGKKLLCLDLTALRHSHARAFSEQFMSSPGERPEVCLDRLTQSIVLIFALKEKISNYIS